MAEPTRLGLYNIPAHRAFADALAAGLMRRFGGDPLKLARGLVLVPNNRSKRAVTDAFVRASGRGLVLPRLVAIGDAGLDEAAGVAIDPAEGDSTPLPPAVPPLLRRLVLARLAMAAAAGGASTMDAAEAVRLAGELGRTLDQLLVEQIAPDKLRAIESAQEHSEHWQKALAMFEVVASRWPAACEALGMMDLVARRNALLQRLSDRWRAAPPPGFVCAAGITDSAPAVARLLRTVAGLDNGLVILPDVALDMDEAEWQALGPHKADPDTGTVRRSVETHPQFHLKLLLDRMGVNRTEFLDWQGGAGPRAPATRSRAVANAMAPAAFTGKWPSLPADERRLSGIVMAEFATPAEEAQAIALVLRETLEVPERTAALVTPDRVLARRVAAHLRRWNIAIDDSAGAPLATMPPGTLLLLIADAVAEDFAPMPLLALLKHPLVRTGDLRAAWLEGARTLDLALRGPRPAAGLAGLDAHFGATPERRQALFARARDWWQEVRALLAPLEAAFAQTDNSLATIAATLREAATALAGDAAWAGQAGRAAADMLAALEVDGIHGPANVDKRSLTAILDTLMRDIAVRPPQGGHPRLAIYGLIEARLQRADLMVLGGLNEGVWPGPTAPDPWLSPRIRQEIGLPGLDRRIGISAHDFSAALGAPSAIMTRARRDARSPTTPSRFWLRLEALSGDRLDGREELLVWARGIDAPTRLPDARPPAPVPPASLRPREIAVTDIDRLKADPFAFYARHILRLRRLDAVDADPNAAWRGTAIHDVLEHWAKEDDCDPATLEQRALALFEQPGVHAIMRAMWRPRMMAAFEWVAQQAALDRLNHRMVAAAEKSGSIEHAGVKLTGKADRIDSNEGGTLAIIDYKTGKPPSAKAVAAGFSLQLGLLGLIAERGGFSGISGTVEQFEYWSMAKGNNKKIGYRASPVSPTGEKGKIATDKFVEMAAGQLTDVAGHWLTGSAPFTAKLHPQYAQGQDYDQLMRLDEWYGRRRG